MSVNEPEDLADILHVLSSRLTEPSACERTNEERSVMGQQENV